MYCINRLIVAALVCICVFLWVKSGPWESVIKSFVVSRHLIPRQRKWYFTCLRLMEGHKQESCTFLKRFVVLWSQNDFSVVAKRILTRNRRTNLWSGSSFVCYVDTFWSDGNIVIWENNSRMRFRKESFFSETMQTSAQLDTNFYETMLLYNWTSGVPKITVLSSL